MRDTLEKGYAEAEGSVEEDDEAGVFAREGGTGQRTERSVNDKEIVQMNVVTGSRP